MKKTILLMTMYGAVAQPGPLPAGLTNPIQVKPPEKGTKRALVSTALQVTNLATSWLYIRRR